MNFTNTRKIFLHTNDVAKILLPIPTISALYVWGIIH